MPNANYVETTAKVQSMDFVLSTPELPQVRPFYWALGGVAAFFFSLSVILSAHFLGPDNHDLERMKHLDLKYHSVIKK